MDHVQYRIPLTNGRSMTVPQSQLQRIARGLGEHLEDVGRDGHEEAIVRALCALPATDRAEALAVVQLRFGEKQDVETIAHDRDLSPWRVWQLEESFTRALEASRASRAAVVDDLIRQMESSATARIMGQEMLANSIAHGERRDLDRAHEASLER